jgi:hypothetical protein
MPMRRRRCRRYRSGLPDLSRIVTLFAAASVNYPRVTFDIPERNAFIVLSLCGEKSRTPGAVNVTNGEAFGSVENRFSAG